MISGAYLGPLCLELLKTAVEDGILSSRLIDLAMTWDTLSTKDMDDFLGNPFLPDSPFAGPSIDQDDREMLVHLFSGVVARAAMLSAVNISAAVIKSGQGRNCLYPVCINIDGSTFYKTNWFESRVEAYLRTQLLDAGVYYDLVFVENAPIIGAAIAGLTS
jgi:hexokinase